MCQEGQARLRLSADRAVAKYGQSRASLQQGRNWWTFFCLKLPNEEEEREVAIGATERLLGNKQGVSHRPTPAQPMAGLRQGWVGLTKHGVVCAH